MANNLLQILQQFFKEVSHENIRLWCEALDLIEIYNTTERSEIIGEKGIEQIENQATSARSAMADVELEEPTIMAGTVKQSVDELVLTKQDQAVDAMQTAAATISEKIKVMNLSTINENNSLFDSIRNNVQIGAIPMIFAVFSRKNDYYGLGSQGTDTSSGGSGR
jgi:hypothetical protein